MEVQFLKRKIPRRRQIQRREVGQLGIPVRAKIALVAALEVPTVKGTVGIAVGQLGIFQLKGIADTLLQFFRSSSVSVPRSSK